MTSLALFSLFGTAVNLATATDCPSQGDVAAELARLAPPARGSSPQVQAQGRPQLSAELRWVGESLSIALTTAEGTLVAERTLARSGSCLDMAAASAVVITAWEGEMRGDLGPELPASSEGEGPRNVSLPEPAIAAQAKPFASTPRHARPWEIGASVLASHESDLAPGLMIDAEVGRPQSGLAARLGLVATGAHTLALGPNPGQSRWSRAALSLGASSRIWLGNSAFDGHVDGSVAMIRLAGAGFGANFSQTGFDLGFGAGIRWAWATSRLAPFVGLHGGVWPSQTFVTAVGTNAQVRLPLFELRAAAGLSFGRFR